MSVYVCVRVLIDVLQWTPLQRLASFDQPARTYQQQLCVSTGCSLEDLPGAMDDRNGWKERVQGICANRVT